MILYHATFRKRLKSIKEYGLGAKQLKNWDFSETGEVYFTTDPYTAESFCECADNVSESVYESGIVVLAVDSRVLHNKNIKRDGNIHDELISFTYKGVVDPRYLYVVCKGELVGKLVDLKRVPSHS